MHLCAVLCCVGTVCTDCGRCVCCVMRWSSALIELLRCVQVLFALLSTCVRVSLDGLVELDLALFVQWLRVLDQLAVL